VPIAVTVSGIVISVSRLQFSNALLPIDETGRFSISCGISTSFAAGSQLTISIVPSSRILYVRYPYRLAVVVVVVSSDAEEVVVVTCGQVTSIFAGAY
jgi:hypothetical protein